MVLASYVLVGGVALLSASIGVTYTMAVAQGHVEAIWPYVSYTGNYPVESCIFSAALSVGSAILVLVVVLRYSQLEDVISRADFPDDRRKRTDRHNRISLAAGLVAAFGLSVTGCFQQRTFHAVHILGVVLCVCAVQVYNAYQTAFSFSFMSARTGVCVRRFRYALLVLAAAAAFVIVVLSARLFFSRGHDSLCCWHWTEIPADRQKDDSDVIAVVEWVLFTFILMFIGSLYPDLKKISLEKDRVVLLE